MPRGELLGSLEYIVLLAVTHLGDEAYGMTVRREIESRTGRDLSIGAIYSTLERLEAKGLVSSYTGEPTAQRGGLVLCEDGDGIEYVHGLTTDGVIFRFIQNNADLRLTPVNAFNQDYRGSEFAGACYSPDGKWLFVNIQSPGITFAITGPWGSGGI